MTTPKRGNAYALAFKASPDAGNQKKPPSLPVWIVRAVFVYLPSNGGL